MIKAEFSLPFYLHLSAFLCRAASCWKKQPNLPGEMVYSDVSGKSSCFLVAEPILLPDPPLPRGSDADSESSQGHKTCLVLESSAGKYNKKEVAESITVVQVVVSEAEQLFDRIRAVIFQASERGNTEAAILNALVFENLKCVVKNRLHHAARCAGSVAGDVRHVASFAEKWDKHDECHDFSVGVGSAAGAHVRET